MRTWPLSSLAVLGLLSLSPVVYADGCALSIDANDAMQYSVKHLEVPASCTDVTLTLHHIGKLPVKAMGHNWVLTRKADAAAVASAGAAAGAAQEYLPSGDARVIAATKRIGGGESASVTFSTAALKASEDYSYFCSFPGHASMMKGTLTLAK